MLIKYSSLILIFIYFFFIPFIQNDSNYSNIDILDKSKNTSNCFKNFTNLFINKKSPITIKEDSIYSYHEKKYNKNIGLFEKTDFNIIPDSLLHFIPQNTISNEDLYLAIYKLDISLDYDVIIYGHQYNNQQNEFDCLYWLYICTYTKSGKLIDWMKLAGYTHNELDKNALINEDYSISTQLFTYQQKSSYYPLVEATEEISLFNIAKNGKFFCDFTLQRKVLFNGNNLKELKPFEEIDCRK